MYSTRVDLPEPSIPSIAINLLFILFLIGLLYLNI